jgi:hypothetical protein
MAIAEQQYGTAATVQFTQFTSCIGLLGYNGGQVTGVHLVMVSNDDTVFDNQAADLAVQALGVYTSVVVIGETDLWEANVGAAYNYLLGLLNNSVIIETGDGIYGGRVENGVPQYWDQPDGTAGQYVDVP